MHHRNPSFIPPFPGSVAKLFKPASPFQAKGKLFPLVALKDGQAVGRIACVLNHRHNDYYKDKTGFFGFFDFINDSDVAFALLEAGKKWLREQGCDRVRGPYNPTINDELGLLVEGFEQVPFVMTPFNPSYYVSLYQELGLLPARELYAFLIDLKQQTPEKVARVVERVRKRDGFTVRNVRLDRLEEELKIIRDLYNVTLDRNWGFVPLSQEEIDFAAHDLRSIVSPELVLIAEKEGKPAGFSMVIPDINEFMGKAKRLPKVLRILYFAAQLKMTHPTRARLAVLGVKPEFRNSGLAAVFYYESLIRGKKQYALGELSWVESNNQEIIKGIERMGGQVYKKYKLYEVPLRA